MILWASCFLHSVSETLPMGHIKRVEKQRIHIGVWSAHFNLETRSEMDTDEDEDTPGYHVVVACSLVSVWRLNIGGVCPVSQCLITVGAGPEHRRAVTTGDHTYDVLVTIRCRACCHSGVIVRLLLMTPEICSLKSHVMLSFINWHVGTR